MGSGLKVNESKTEPYLFYKRDNAPVTLHLDTKVLQSKETIVSLNYSFLQSHQALRLFKI